MKTILVYLLQMIIASGILYSYFHFFLRNKKFHRYNRYYLLMAVVVSITIPFFNIPVYFTPESVDNSFVLQTLNIIASPAVNEETTVAFVQSVQPAYNWLSWQNIFYAVYFLTAIVFITRIIFSVRKIKIISRNYPSEKIGDIHFINTTEPGTPFSFFKWLFWNKNIELQSEKGEQIFRHELFHIQQKHSSDIVFIETITALGWLNPFFHLIKKELKAIHEFLADEYAMEKTESWKYAELLLMQALNTKQNLVNPFFHTQIKRRIAMITKSQKPGHQYLRKLLVLPVATIIIALFAFSYKNRKAANDSIIRSTEPITIVVDAGHGGTDKGAKSIDKKYNEADLTLEISKLIQQLAPEYNINVVMTREDENFPGGANDVKESLRKRVEISNSLNAAAFISVHVNTAGMPGKPTTRSGFELYISKRKEVENDKRLASGILDEVSRIYKTDKVIKQREQQGIFVLDNTAAAAINLECGYITNSKDLAFITDKANQEKIARAILEGISKFANTTKLTVSEVTLDDTPKLKYPDTLLWVKTAKPLEKKLPTTEQLKKWQDAKTYGVWLDGKRASNSTLSKYRPADFGNYNESKLEKNAVNYGKHYYQVNLFTKNYYDEKIVKTWKKFTKDTTKPLIIIDKQIFAKMNLDEIDINIDPEQIESITVLKPPTSIVKYGEDGKNGVIEIYTKKYIAQHPEIKEERDSLHNKFNKNNNPPLQEVVVMGYKSNNPVNKAEPVFEKIETPPAFPGGATAWAKYLEKNLDVSAPLSSGAKPGTYTVIVKFIVDKTGAISSIRPLTNHGFGMEAEVVRVIAKGPNWIPAKQNGHLVNAYQTQPVTFVITGETKTITSKNIPLEKVREIEQNKTTLSQIQSMFGDPTSKSLDGKSSYFVYDAGSSRLDVQFDRSNDVVTAFRFTMVAKPTRDKEIIDFDIVKTIKENQTKLKDLEKILGRTPHQIELNNNEEYWTYEGYKSNLAVMSKDRRSGVINAIKYDN